MYTPSVESSGKESKISVLDRTVRAITFGSTAWAIENLWIWYVPSLKVSYYFHGDAGRILRVCRSFRSLYIPHRQDIFAILTRTATYSRSIHLLAIQIPLTFVPFAFHVDIRKFQVKNKFYS